MTIENEDGSWQGYWSGVRGPSDPWVHHITAELTGGGAYDGLSALLFYEGTYGVNRFDGLVYEGAMPPMSSPASE